MDVQHEKALHHRNLGTFFYSKRQFSKALIHYTLSLNCESSHSNYTNRCAAYIHFGRFEEAECDAQQSLHIDRSWFRGWHRLAQLSLFKQNLKDAKKFIGEGIRRVPKENTSAVKQLKKLRKKIKEANLDKKTPKKKHPSGYTEFFYYLDDEQLPPILRHLKDDDLQSFCQCLDTSPNLLTTRYGADHSNLLELTIVFHKPKFMSHLLTLKPNFIFSEFTTGSSLSCCLRSSSLECLEILIEKISKMPTSEKSRILNKKMCSMSNSSSSFLWLCLEKDSGKCLNRMLSKFRLSDIFVDEKSLKTKGIQEEFCEHCVFPGSGSHHHHHHHGPKMEGWVDFLAAACGSVAVSCVEQILKFRLCEVNLDTLITASSISHKVLFDIKVEDRKCCFLSENGGECVHVQILRKLMKHVNNKFDKREPLRRACIESHVQVVKFFCEEVGVQVGNQELFLSVQGNCFGVVKYLMSLRKKNKTLFRNSKRYFDEDEGGSFKPTILIAAIMTENVKLVELLCENKIVDVNLVLDGEGDTFVPLKLSVCSYNLGLVKCLMRYGAKMRLARPNSQENTAIMLGINTGNCGIVEFLLSKNPHPENRVHLLGMLGCLGRTVTNSNFEMLKIVVKFLQPVFQSSFCDYFTMPIFRMGPICDENGKEIRTSRQTREKIPKMMNFVDMLVMRGMDKVVDYLRRDLFEKYGNVPLPHHEITEEMKKAGEENEIRTLENEKGRLRQEYEQIVSQHQNLELKRMKMTQSNSHKKEEKSSKKKPSFDPTFDISEKEDMRKKRQSEHIKRIFENYDNNNLLLLPTNFPELSRKKKVEAIKRLVNMMGQISRRKSKNRVKLSERQEKRDQMMIASIQEIAKLLISPETRKILLFDKNVAFFQNLESVCIWTHGKQNEVKGNLKLKKRIRKITFSEMIDKHNSDYINMSEVVLGENMFLSYCTLRLLNIFGTLFDSGEGERVFLTKYPGLASFIAGNLVFDFVENSQFMSIYDHCNSFRMTCTIVEVAWAYTMNLMHQTPMFGMGDARKHKKERKWFKRVLKVDESSSKKIFHTMKWILKSKVSKAKIYKKKKKVENEKEFIIQELSQIAGLLDPILNAFYEWFCQKVKKSDIDECIITIAKFIIRSIGRMPMKGVRTRGVFSALEQLAKLSREHPDLFHEKVKNPSIYEFVYEKLLVPSCFRPNGEKMGLYDRGWNVVMMSEKVLDSVFGSTSLAQKWEMYSKHEGKICKMIISIILGDLYLEKSRRRKLRRHLKNISATGEDMFVGLLNQACRILHQFLSIRQVYEDMKKENLLKQVFDILLQFSLKIVPLQSKNSYSLTPLPRGYVLGMKGVEYPYKEKKKEEMVLDTTVISFYRHVYLVFQSILMQERRESHRLFSKMNKANKTLLRVDEWENRIINEGFLDWVIRSFFNFPPRVQGSMLQLLLIFQVQGKLVPILKEKKLDRFMWDVMHCGSRANNHPILTPILDIFVLTAGHMLDMDRVGQITGAKTTIPIEIDPIDDFEKIEIFIGDNFKTMMLPNQYFDATRRNLEMENILKAPSVRTAKDFKNWEKGSKIFGDTKEKSTKKNDIYRNARSIANLKNYSGGGTARICEFCKQMMSSPMKCGRCRRVHYCSKNCQKKDWKVHKKTCKKADEPS